MASRNKKKWNRVHFFKRKKSSSHQVGHPAYVYGQSKNNYKYLTITHTPENGVDYERLKHNIDSDKDGIEDSYLKKKFEIDRKDRFKDPDKKYRFHSDDIPTVKKYKK